MKNKMATLLVIVSAMLIGAGMTWQQRLLFVGGIVFGLVVEALPELSLERDSHRQVEALAGGERVQGSVEKQ